ncbi:MAG: HAD family hydrolase [Burkholderiales bacterium]|nr:HAD family hydrolase [Burkholderiales bacterium]
MPAPRDDRPVVLFDWGETLMWIPGMIHDPDRHLACVEEIYDERIRPHVRGASGGAPVGRFVEHYLLACRRQIAQSKATQREHSFADRFAMAFALAGVDALPPRAVFEGIADALGDAVARNARLLDGAADVVPRLAATHRLGVVSNYPHGPVVAASLARFGLLRHFEAVVVSSETGWMKPHADCYRPALAALAADPARTLMVGDDLVNDVRGAKALGLHTAWLAPHATALDAAVDIHLRHLDELPAHCARLFA